MPADQPVIGIMALYVTERRKLEERSYFAKLIAQAEKMGMRAFVFTPEDVRGREILGHFYNPSSGTWQRKLTPFPDVIYDRCRYQPTPRFRQLQRFRLKYPNLLYTNRPLANKWVIYQLLSKNRSISRNLPETIMVRNAGDVMSLLNRHRMIYTKPINGTGGRGVMRIEMLPSGNYQVRGRDMHRRILKPRTCGAVQLEKMLKGLVRKGNYLAQRGIETRLANGRVHDFRVLMQKNEHGNWQFTGGAARVGPSGSITSNLHGGGSAAAMDRLLEQRFGDASRVQAIQREVEQLCFEILRELEKKFTELCEMAFDLAIDKNGRIWLLELNPKPSREVFRRVGQPATYAAAIRRPLEYARWIYQNRREILRRKTGTANKLV
jgi:glutathione synthase/RimK-type ligase-like ATP-grasp enzyme